MSARKRVAIYVRVSSDGQTVENQKRELEAVAKRHGWEVAEVFSDHGISEQKRSVRRLTSCSTHSEERIRRSSRVERGQTGALASATCSFPWRATAKGVDLYLHNRDRTSTPAGKALFQCSASSLSSSGP